MAVTLVNEKTGERINCNECSVSIDWTVTGHINYISCSKDDPGAIWLDFFYDGLWIKPSPRSITIVVCEISLFTHPQVLPVDLGVPYTLITDKTTVTSVFFDGYYRSADGLVIVGEAEEVKHV